MLTMSAVFIFCGLFAATSDGKSNRRTHLPGYAVWEIHPVMAITVDQ